MTQTADPTEPITGSRRIRQLASWSSVPRRWTGCSPVTSTPSRPPPTLTLLDRGRLHRMRSRSTAAAHDPPLDEGAARCARSSKLRQASPDLDLPPLAVAGVRRPARRVPDPRPEVANDFRMFADATWLAGQMLWAEALIRCSHQPAAVLYQRLLPWHDQFGHPPRPQGVAHYLGCLAHTLDLVDEADRWFSEAWRSTKRWAPLRRLTQTAWAELLPTVTGRRRRPGSDLAAPRCRAGAATATSNVMPARCSNGSASSRAPER